MLHGHKPKSESHRLSNHDRSPAEQRTGYPPLKSTKPSEQPLPKGVRKSDQTNGQAKIGSLGMESRGQKRKAGRVKEPPARRRRKNVAITKDAIETMDTSYVRKTMHIPTQEDYPSLPVTVFEHPKQAIHDALQGPVAVISKVHEQISNGRIKRCLLSCVDLDIQDVIGEGISKVMSYTSYPVSYANVCQVHAETAAFSHFMAKLHELGKFQQIFEINKAVNGDFDAKVDVYNYAARFDCVPEFEVRTAVKKMYRSRKTVYEVEISMPEQNIKVTGKGIDYSSAERVASTMFKREAETFQIQQGTESFVVKDSAALTTNNAKSFFEYYKILHPKSRVDVELKDENGEMGRQIRGQVTIDGEPVGKGISMRASTKAKKKAEDLAYLTAALEVKNREPAMYPGFLKALKEGNGEILRPVPPIPMPVDDDCLLMMRNALIAARQAGLSDDAHDIVPDEASDATKRPTRRVLTESETIRRHWHLQTQYTAYLHDPRLEQVRKKRAELPMSQYKAKVLDLISNNLYSIVIGATGSGKTTQVPQILLDHAIANGVGGACNVVCTQPRRIAATSVARRVAEERAEPLQESVGYQVRFDTKLPHPGGGIVYCTTGVLLNQLQRNPDEVMDRTTHFVIDEVHERDILIDFLMIILKKVVAQRLADGKSVPKIVLMSATMDADLFASYFSSKVEDKEVRCPSIDVPGRTFPVTEKYLNNILEELKATYTSQDLQLLDSDRETREYLAVDRDFSKANPTYDDEKRADTVQPDDFVIDWKKERKVNADGEETTSFEKENGLVPHGLVATMIAHIAKTTDNGAILTFLPGLEEITAVDKLLRNVRPLGIDVSDKSKYQIYLLHSSLAAGQQEVFNDVPDGCRKIILATNIAETSITIPDVQYVVDTGKLREKQYDQARRITKLECTWVSKSNAKQRAGRAGRVQNGYYYALYYKSR